MLDTFRAERGTARLTTSKPCPVPDSGSLDIHRKPRNALPSIVRNKDRMAVEPIVRLTGPTVLNVLEEVTFVVYTVVPEKCRFWKSNQGGQASL